MPLPEAAPGALRAARAPWRARRPIRPYPFLPGPVTIGHFYVLPSRLTEANYDGSDYYHDGYHGVGSRLTQDGRIATRLISDTHACGGANRLTSVNGAQYT